MLFVLLVKGSVLFLTWIRSSALPSPAETFIIPAMHERGCRPLITTISVREEGRGASCHPSIGEYRHIVRVDEVPAAPLLDRSRNWWWRTMRDTIRQGLTCVPTLIGTRSPPGGRGTRGPQHGHGMNGWACTMLDGTGTEDGRAKGARHGG